MMYNGIELERPKGPVSMSHSVFVDMIRGQSSTANMDWTDVQAEIPWGKLKKDYPEAYHNSCVLFSLLKMDYQVCNGGIAQYFDNGYHKSQPAHTEDDIDLLPIGTVKEEFKALVEFGRVIFPERTEENDALERASAAFALLEYEENARVDEIIYCEEDEYILDEETGEEIENPDWFEPYDDYHYEDVIHCAENFNEIFYDANDYMEELLELRAQLYCKQLEQDIEKMGVRQQEAMQTIQSIFPKPEPAFDRKLREDQDRAAGTSVAELPIKDKELSL